MSEFKHKYSVFEIDKEDGALKFLYMLKTNDIPQIGSTIGYIIDDEKGTPSRRVYHKIENIIYPVSTIEENVRVVGSCCEPVIHAVLEIDEPILNGVI